MTPEAQRIAIAGECPEWLIHHGGRYCSIIECESGPLMGRLFDPLNDLNAMHEAVATLTREEYDADEGFTYWLARVVHGMDADGVEVGWNFYELQEATAAQRAEAFLRTKNLWQDT